MFANNRETEITKPESPQKKQEETEAPKQEHKPSSSLFGNLPPPQTNSFFGSSISANTPSIFANANKTEDEAPKKSGLFDGLLSNKPEENKPSSFFGSATTSGPTKSGLFDGLLNSNLSNNTGCGTNLFNTGATPLTGIFSKAGGNDEEDEEAVNEDEEVVPGQEDNADPTKSTGTYKYESTTTDILTVV